MDFLQVKYILAIAESDSMTAAAEQLHISQSALSQSYKRLEWELGVALFRKKSRNLELTPAGEVFCAKARSVVDAMNQLETAMQKIVVEETLRILVCSEAVDFTDEAIALYSRLHADLTLQQVRGSTKEIQSMLSAGTTPFAVTLSPDFGSDITARLLLDEPVLALVSERDLLGREELSMSDFRNRSLVTLREGMAANRLFYSFFEQAGVSPGQVIEVNDPETITMQIGSGNRVGFIPESTANSNSARISRSYIYERPIPLREPFCRRRVYLITREDQPINRTTQDFLEFLIRFGAYTQQNHHFPSEVNQLL